MLTIKPRDFDEIQTLGVATVFPDTRVMPYITPAVLLDAKRNLVYYPPFHIENGLLSKVGDKTPVEEFEDLVDQGEATRIPGLQARSDGCFFFPAGNGPPEYTSLTSIARKVSEFANEKAASGDNFFRAGKPALALAEYELAAATSQAPEHYARLLLVPLSPRRKERIHAALAQVAGPKPVEAFIQHARAEIQRFS